MIRPIILLLLIPPLVLLCVLLTMGLGLSTTSQAIVTGVVLVGYFSGFCVYLFRQVLHLGRRYDGVMTTAGLDYSHRQGVSCQYCGTASGRPMTVHITPAYRFQPWRVEVSVAASPVCRIALGSTRPLLDCRKSERLRIEGALQETHIYTDDPKEARRLLAVPRMTHSLVDLLDQLGSTNSWELYLQPDRVWLRARAYHIPEATIVAWLRSAFAVAEACEQSH